MRAFGMLGIGLHDTLLPISRCNLQTWRASMVTTPIFVLAFVYEKSETFIQSPTSVLVGVK